jgi:hypothetical protein
MTLIATVKGSTSNSYLTVADATDLLNTYRLYTDDWDNATTDQKERSLIWATRLIDESYDWYGAKRTLEQALDWPRAGMLTKDGNFVDYDLLPLKLQLAVVDQAIYLLQKNPTTTPQLLGQGFSQASVGPLSVTVDKNARLDFLTPSLLLDLREWGNPVGSGFGGFQQVPLMRD